MISNKLKNARIGSNKLHIATALITNSVRLLFILKSALNYPERSGSTFRIFSPPLGVRTTRSVGGANPSDVDRGDDNTLKALKARVFTEYNTAPLAALTSIRSIGKDYE